MKSIAIIGALFLAACSSTSQPTREQIAAAAQAQAEAATTTAAFAGGNLKLTFGKDGQWLRITSTATANILGNDSGSTAKTVATMKANRQIAEFLNTELNSKRGLLTVARSVEGGAKDAADPESDDVDSQSTATAQKVRESIVQSSRAILRGGLVEGEYIDQDKRQAVVVVVVDRNSVEAVKNIRISMGNQP